MSRPTLVIDPGMGWGAPCVAGTRIPASALAGCVMAGDSVDGTAEAYGVQRADVLLSCWWEVWEARQGRRTRRNRTILDAWGDWADEVFPRLAGYDGFPPPHDPPVVPQSPKGGRAK